MADFAPYSGPVVDAHAHVWDPFRNPHPWLSGPDQIPFRYGDYAPLKRRYGPEEYRADAAGHDVIETVYIEAEWDPADPIGETRYVSGLNAAFGFPHAVVAQAWLDGPDASYVLAAQAGFELVRSVRHKPGGPSRPDAVGAVRTLMSDERWRRGYAELARHDLHFDLQTPWWNLGEAALLARDFPDTMLVLNHAGLPSDRTAAGLDGWRDALDRLGHWPNVRLKISGLGQAGVPWSVEANRTIVLDAIAIFGAERCMFGSNFPVDGLCGSFDRIYAGFKAITAHMPESDQRRLFSDNARALYRTAPDSIGKM